MGRRQRIIWILLALAALVAQAQFSATGSAPTPAPTSDGGAASQALAAPLSDGGGGPTEAAAPLLSDGGVVIGTSVADGGSAELQALQSQLAAEQEQLRIQQEQAATQLESQQTLERMQTELQALRQRVADADARAQKAEQERVTKTAHVEDAIALLAQADDAIALGHDVDLSQLVPLLPREPAAYVQAADEALGRRDYVTARYFVELALSVARRSRYGDQATGY